MSFWQALVGTQWYVRSATGRGRIVDVAHIDETRAMLVGERPNRSAKTFWWVDVAELMGATRNDDTTQYVYLGTESASWFGPGQWVIRTESDVECYTLSNPVLLMSARIAVVNSLAWQVNYWSQNMGTVFFNAISEDGSRPLPDQHSIRRLSEPVSRFVKGGWRPANAKEIQHVADVRQQLLNIAAEQPVEEKAPEEPIKEIRDEVAPLSEESSSNVWTSF